MICRPVAIGLEHGTRCAVCRRSLLVGEQARAYHDPRTRGLQSVCPLCTARAERTGWQAIGEEARRPLQVQGNGAVDPDHLVQRLQADLERLERDLGGKEQELSGERLSHEEAAAMLHNLATQLEAARSELARSRGALAEAERGRAEAQAAQESLLRARRRENDPSYLCGIAVEVFNRSSHARDLEALSATHGAPRLRVGVEGIGLPRAVRVVADWPDGRASYRVTCDLVARIFDVEDLAHGAGLQPRNGAFESNASLTAGRLELAGASRVTSPP